MQSTVRTALLSPVSSQAKFCLCSRSKKFPGRIHSSLVGKFTVWRSGIDFRKQPAALNLRSHSLDKLRQIVTTGALVFQLPLLDLSGCMVLVLVLRGAPTCSGSGSTASPHPAQKV
eukprot:COSAG01_NODE_1662_length_9555_cov_32.392718_5_plen_116_part_00